MKISNRWRQMAEIYKRFTPTQPCYCFSEESALEMFSYESTGHPKLNLTDKNLEGKYNGYMVGKHWMDATIKMWREDIDNGLLLATELDFPEWFLKKIL